MKFFGGLIVGIVVGLVVAGIVGWNAMPGMMLHEHQSPYSVDETVERIKKNAEEAGWVVAGVSKLHKSVEKHGAGPLPPVVLVNLCQAHYATEILKDDDNKVVSVMMPCTIAVYEKSDGKAYIGTLDTKLLGSMFGGAVKRIMAGSVAAEQQKFIRMD